MKNVHHRSPSTFTFFLAFFSLLTFSLSLRASDAFNLKGRSLSNGNIKILGYDNVEREAVLLTPDEYSYFTNAVAYLNTFKDFRRQLHGKVVKRETDVERRVLCVHHADGYVWEEPMREFTGPVAKPTSSRSTPAKPNWMTDKQWAAKRRKAAAASTVKTINATYAPGGKLLEVK